VLCDSAFAGWRTSLRPYFYLLQAFSVRMTKPAAGRIFHQCVFIVCEQDEPLLEAAASIRRALGVDDDLNDYMPHISLLYSDIEVDKRCVFFLLRYFTLHRETSVLCKI
jgi:hypothetical protein